MNKHQNAHFDNLYREHVNALTRQGKSKVTIDSYARAVRRISAFFDRCPDQLSQDDLKDYFTSLIRTHSWSTVKIDRNGLQFFYKQVLNKNMGLGRYCKATEENRVARYPIDQRS